MNDTVEISTKEICLLLFASLFGLRSSYDTVTHDAGIMIWKAHKHQHRASFFKRLLAAVYDVLIAFGLYMVVGLVAVLLYMLLMQLGWFGVPENFESFNANPRKHLFYLAWIRFVPGAVIVYFYCWCWAKGQTLGMQAWGLQVRAALSGQSDQQKRAFMRFCWSLLGIGNVLMLFRQDQLALQDKLTQTEVVFKAKV